MIKIHVMFDNCKPDIETGHRKNTFINNFDLQNIFKLGIVVLERLNKMLVIVFDINFFLNIGQNPKNSVFQFVPICTRNRPSESFTIKKAHNPVFQNSRKQSLLPTENKNIDDVIIKTDSDYLYAFHNVS